VAARGQARTAQDLAAGIAHVAEAAATERPGAFRAARNLVRQSYEREKGALASVRRLAARGRTPDYVAQATERLEDGLNADLRSLERAWSAITGRNLPSVEPTRDEQAMDAVVYAPVADLSTWLAAMDKVKPVEGLHRMMQFEAYNFADGKRSALEVYDAVAAEALAAGRWYYGVVRPSDVREALDRAARAGAFTTRKR